MRRFSFGPVDPSDYESENGQFGLYDDFIEVYYAQSVAHICENGTIRPYPRILCSCCKGECKNLTARELCQIIHQQKDKNE